MLASSVLLACNPPTGFECANDMQCRNEDGEQGICSSLGGCGYTDPNCPFGYRYSEAAPSSLAGMCVGPTSETTSGSTGDPGSTSSSVTTLPASESSSSSSTTTGGSSTTAAVCASPEGCESVDVLFIIDNSESMTEDFAALLPAFTDLDALIGPIVDQYCGYHVGVTTTEVAPDYQPVECQVRGALNQSGALAGGTPCFDGDHPPFLTEEDPITDIGCLLAVGQNYDDDEKQIDTMLAALDPSLAVEGGCNEGFRRPGTPLIIVMITDEDDDDDSRLPMESPNRTGSEGNPGGWFSSLTALEDPEDVGLILIAADQSGGCDWVPDVDDDGSGAEYPARLLTFSQYFAGSSLATHVEVINMCADPLEIVAQLAGLSTVIEAVCEDAARR